jgi:hypothetical protein
MDHRLAIYLVLTVSHKVNHLKRKNWTTLKKLIIFQKLIIKRVINVTKRRLNYIPTSSLFIGCLKLIILLAKDTQLVSILTSSSNQLSTFKPFVMISQP